MEKLLSGTWFGALFNRCLYADPGYFLGYIHHDVRAINIDDRTRPPGCTYRTLDGWVIYPTFSKGSIWSLNIPISNDKPVISQTSNGHLAFFNSDTKTYELIRARKIHRDELTIKGLFL